MLKIHRNKNGLVRQHPTLVSAARASERYHYFPRTALSSNFLTAMAAPASLPDGRSSISHAHLLRSPQRDETI